MGLLPSKSQGMTILYTLAVVMLINKVPALESARKAILTDGSLFS